MTEHRNDTAMPDGEPVRDWLVTFAHKVATEQSRCARNAKAVFCVMLRRDEAEGFVEQTNELVQRLASGDAERLRTALVERVARALYERAMSERRAFGEPQKFSKRWDDPPHDDLTAESRPSSWRDGWRDDARAALAEGGV
jgi:hypothetical protein